MNDQLSPTDLAKEQERRRKAVLATAAWREKNPEARKALARAYYHRNKDRNRDKKRIYNQEHRAERKALKHVYLGRKYSAEGSYTADEARRLIASYNNKCAYCQEDLVVVELDHRIPLSKGGSNWIENILPACRQCNASKNDRTEEEFRAPNPAPRVIVSRTIPVPDGHAKCSRCDEIKALDLFYKDSRKKNGHQGWCKSCANAHHKAFVNADGREKFRAYMRDYYAKNKERVQASNRKYRDKKRLSK